MSNEFARPFCRHVLSLSFLLFTCSTAHLLYEKNRYEERFFSWSLCSWERNSLSSTVWSSHRFQWPNLDRAAHPVSNSILCNCPGFPIHC